MLKFVIFIITLLALSVADVSAMRRARLNREIAPYAILAAAAGVAALLAFTDNVSLMGGALRLFGDARYVII